MWVNYDENERPNPKPNSKIPLYTRTNLEWVEKTKRQLKRIYDWGYKPFYLKGYLGNREKKLLKM